MDLHELPFVKISKLKRELAEITVGDGIDINMEMVKQIHNLLLSTFTDSFSLLINKTNSNTNSIKFLLTQRDLKGLEARL